MLLLSLHALFLGSCSEWGEHYLWLICVCLYFAKFSSIYFNSQHFEFQWIERWIEKKKYTEQYKNQYSRTVWSKKWFWFYKNVEIKITEREKNTFHRFNYTSTIPFTLFNKIHFNMQIPPILFSLIDHINGTMMMHEYDYHGMLKQI